MRDSRPSARLRTAARCGSISRTGVLRLCGFKRASDALDNTSPLPTPHRRVSSSAASSLHFTSSSAAPTAMPAVRKTAKNIGTQAEPTARRDTRLWQATDPPTLDHYPLAAVKGRVNVIMKTFDNEIGGRTLFHRPCWRVGRTSARRAWVAIGPPNLRPQSWPVGRTIEAVSPMRKGYFLYIDYGRV
jgi:hypothetical protein